MKGVSRDFTKYNSRTCQYCSFQSDSFCKLKGKRVNKWNCCKNAIIESNGKRYSSKGVEDINE